MKQLAIALLALLSASVASYAADAEAPKHELRSTWFTTHVRIDWPSTTGTTATVRNRQKQELITYLDNFERRNLTGICIQVRSLSDAIYPSELEPWAAVISGTRGVDPGWDPLGFAVEECHKRGLECWAWINPFRQRTKAANYNTPFDKDWEERGLLLTHEDYSIFDPANDEARRHVFDVIRDIYTRYPVDGLLFDDYFYPSTGIPQNATAADYDEYLASGTTLSIGDWRRENINRFMRELNEQIANDRPDLRFGVSPAGVAYLGGDRFGIEPPEVSASDWQYNGIFSDPIAWLADGSIDFISPQIYKFTTNPTAPYEPLCHWWSDVAHRFGRHFYASQGAYRVSEAETPNNETSWADIVLQINLNRQYNGDNAPGTIFFSSKYFDGPTCSGLGQYLLDHAYATKSLLPIVAWKQHPVYVAPSDIVRDGNQLSWPAMQGVRDNSIIRYTIYAVPMLTSITEARSSDGDGIAARYLLKVSYTNEFTIPADYASGYWFAVCVYDGYGYESMPGTLDYPFGRSESATPIAPVADATAEWLQQFVWSPIANAVYTLQVSDSPDFTYVAWQQSDILGDTFTLDLANLPETLTEAWWRVITEQTDRLPAISAAMRFVMPEMLAGVAVELRSPANGAETDRNLTMSWSAADHVDTYVLQVATTPDFDDVLVENRFDGSTTSYEFPVSLVGEGTFHWRVLAEARHHAVGVSEVRSFAVREISVGAYEPGYVIVKDPASYQPQGDIVIENLWMRSSLPEFANFDQIESGSLNRSMAVLDDFVYVVGRDKASTYADCYINCYNIYTGELVRRLDLSSNCQYSYLPCNSIFRDSAGHLCVANLTLRLAANPVHVQMVDLTTGLLTDVAVVQSDDDNNDRMDHVAVWGDVTSDDFYVFGVGSNTNHLWRWHIVNGEVDETTKVDATSYSPSGTSGFNTAPRIVPFSDKLGYVDGSTTYWSLYDFTTGKMVSKFNSGSSAAPRYSSANGGQVFMMGDKYYHVYNSCTHRNSPGFTFNLASTGTTPDLERAELLWTLPAGGLGTTNSSTYAAPADVLDCGNGTAIVVVYSPGCGLAAYRVSDKAASSVVGPSHDCLWQLSGRTVVFGSPTEVRVYSLEGSLRLTAAHASEITLPAAGTYVVVTPGQSRLITVR